MSNNRKKRLSLIDFFGKSSDATSKNTKKHQRSSSDTSRTPAKSKSNPHRLTFQIPDESIVSKIDLASIPRPPAAVDPKKKYAGLQNSAHNTGSINSSSRIKSVPSKTSPLQDTAAQNENVKLTLPETPTNETEKTQTGPYGPNTPQSTQKRVVSNSSLSSSTYPNELSPIASSRNASNSTLPDFSRQTSSIYPPSTFAHDNHNNSLLPSSGTISKRSDLLRKRKPPPLSLRVKTSTEPNIAHAADIISPSDTIRVSAVDSNHPTEYDSTDSEFTPLNLIPPSTIPGNLQNAPLAADKQLNPAKNVMFSNSTTNYEPPSFHDGEHEYGDTSNNDSQNKNVHKHSRTLSSIEEITSALESFQLEHEKSFNASETSHGQMSAPEGDTDGDPAAGTLSFTSSPVSNKEKPITLNLTRELEGHNVSDVDDNEQAENTDKSKSIIVKVKDLPELENGETLDHYITKLKATVPESKPPVIGTNTEKNNLYELEKPKSMGGGESENSSASDVFFDVDEPSKDASLEENINQDKANKRLDKDTELSEPANLEVNIVTDDDAEYAGDSQSFQPSSSPQVIDDVYREKLDTCSNEDLIDPLDSSFDSFIEQMNSREEGHREDNINGDGAGKCSETQTISTGASNIPEDIVAEDGVWHRYSSATNFFNNADQLHDGKIVDDEDDDKNDVLYGNERTSTHSCDSPSLVLTPTDSKQYVNMGINLGNSSQHRAFDLGDELENNVTAVDSPELSSSKSLEDLYPTHSSDDLHDEGDDDDDDYDDDYDGYEGYADDDGSFINNAKNDHLDNDNYVPNDWGNRERETNYQASAEYVNKSMAGAATSDSSSTERGRNSGDDDDDDDVDDDVLEFSPRSPRSPRSVDSIAEMAKTPDIFRHSSICSRGIERLTGANLTGTPTGLGIGIGAREHLFITNQELDPLEEAEFNETANDEAKRAPIPDIDSNFSSSESEKQQSAGNSEEESGNENGNHQNIYDRREEPTIMPIQHSQVVTPAAPVVGVSPTFKKRRPPPSHPYTGRRSRGLSETTANPEMFLNGIAQQMKPHGNSSGDTDNDVVNKELNVSAGEKQSETSVDNANAVTESEEQGNVEDIEARKGEKCTYIESLRLKSRKTTISMKPSAQTLPIAIRQNGTISHKKIPSQQLTHSFKLRKHVMVKPKTRMLASEIDDGELPDATLIHKGQRTKVPIHPDAAVIAASEQFNKLAKQRASTTAAGDLGRFNSVFSVQPHYGNGMRLFITNPDSDDS